MRCGMTDNIQQQIQKLQEKKTTKAHIQIRRLRAQLKREEKNENTTKRS